MQIFTTYEAARAELIKKLGLTGKVRVKAGVIRLYAEFNGRMLYITGDRQEMNDRVKLYKSQGRKSYFTINPKVLPN